MNFSFLLLLEENFSSSFFSLRTSRENSDFLFSKTFFFCFSIFTRYFFFYFFRELKKINFSRHKFYFFFHSEFSTHGGNFPTFFRLSYDFFSCFFLRDFHSSNKHTIDKNYTMDGSDMKTHQISSFNPRRRGRWMSQRSWYCSTIDQKTETDQQNKRMWMKTKRGEEKKKSAKLSRVSEFLFAHRNSRSPSLNKPKKKNIHQEMKKFLIFFLAVP